MRADSLNGNAALPRNHAPDQLIRAHLQRHQQHPPSRIQRVHRQMERGDANPQLDTILKVLAPLGKTLAIVPLQPQN